MRINAATPRDTELRFFRWACDHDAPLLKQEKELAVLLVQARFAAWLDLAASDLVAIWQTRRGPSLLEQRGIARDTESPDVEAVARRTVVDTPPTSPPAPPSPVDIGSDEDLSTLEEAMARRMRGRRAYFWTTLRGISRERALESTSASY